ncbi:MAG: hypothetical protein OEY01_07825 [Desulfobulbaceae bacterium]|nr:hypothetical protein [Desulfobulbaceae bacterium]HIJ78964.1 hypothetical protein [Deltaproteobacteria bacterium]
MEKIKHSKIYAYDFSDAPGREVTDFIGEIPPRWGRMPVLSRAVVVEAGRVLLENGILPGVGRFLGLGKKVGLIGATKYGSLATDFDFAESLAAGPNLASPALFGYTLPNIPLSEAANQFGLTGPVYAIFAEQNLLEAAVAEAKLWLESRHDLYAMLACAFDCIETADSGPSLSITFTYVS